MDSSFLCLFFIGFPLIFPSLALFSYHYVKQLEEISSMLKVSLSKIREAEL
jgi:hypothetical protein